jgi:hypothetical protein
MNAATVAKVTRVGAGPGDSDLLTPSAGKALRQATVVLVDDPVHPGVLAYLRRSARVLQVGKRGGRPCVSSSADARRRSAASAGPCGHGTAGRAGRRTARGHARRPGRHRPLPDPRCGLEPPHRPARDFQASP